MGKKKKIVFGDIKVEDEGRNGTVLVQDLETSHQDLVSDDTLS